METYYNTDLSVTERCSILTEQTYENTKFIFNSEFKVINSDKKLQFLLKSKI